MTAVAALQGVAVDFGPVQALRGVDLFIRSRLPALSPQADRFVAGEIA